MEQSIAQITEAHQKTVNALSHQVETLNPRNRSVESSNRNITQRKCCFKEDNSNSCWSWRWSPFRGAPDSSLESIDWGQMEYVRVWEGTVYNPVPEQTDSTPHITASNQLIQPGYTIAIGSKVLELWPEVLYPRNRDCRSSGYGQHRVNNRNRFDWLVGDYDFAMALGRFQRRGLADSRLTNRSTTVWALPQ